jgi:hypothetical protein
MLLLLFALVFLALFIVFAVWSFRKRRRLRPEGLVSATHPADGGYERESSLVGLYYRFRYRLAMGLFRNREWVPSKEFLATFKTFFEPDVPDEMRQRIAGSFISFGAMQRNETAEGDTLKAINPTFIPDNVFSDT